MFALRFTGVTADIDPLTPRNGQPAEFDSWRWNGSIASPISWCRPPRSVPDGAQLFSKFAG